MSTENVAAPAANDASPGEAFALHAQAIEKALDICYSANDSLEALAGPEPLAGIKGALEHIATSADEVSQSLFQLEWIARGSLWQEEMEHLRALLEAARDALPNSKDAAASRATLRAAIELLRDVASRQERSVAMDMLRNPEH